MLRPLFPLLPAILQHFWTGQGREWKSGKKRVRREGPTLTCWRGKLVSGRLPPQPTLGVRAAPGHSKKALRGLRTGPSEASHKPDFSSSELLKCTLMVLGPFPFPRADDSACSSCGDPGQRLTLLCVPSTRRHTIPTVSSPLKLPDHSCLSPSCFSGHLFPLI